jgi:transposase
VVDGSRLDAMFPRTGRPSIAPERSIRALLVQVLYSTQSERLLGQQFGCNLLFRWFAGLSADAPVWDASTFSKNRERFTNAEPPAADGGGTDLPGFLGPRTT